MVLQKRRERQFSRKPAPLPARRQISPKRFCRAPGFPNRTPLSPAKCYFFARRRPQPIEEHRQADTGSWVPESGSAGACGPLAAPAPWPTSICPLATATRSADGATAAAIIAPTAVVRRELSASVTIDNRRSRAKERVLMREIGWEPRTMHLAKLRVSRG
jgi:hypothetical protein